MFAYLRGDGDFVEQILARLQDADVSTLCVWPDMAQRVRDYDPSKTRVTRDMVDLGTVLSAADACVNYGSSSVVCSALLAGKPQLMMPLDVEKLMIARRIDHLGAGILVPTDKESIRGGVAALLSDASLVQKAERIARQHLGLLNTRPEDAVVNALAVAAGNFYV